MYICHKCFIRTTANIEHRCYRCGFKPIKLLFDYTKSKLVCESCESFPGTIYK